MPKIKLTSHLKMNIDESKYLISDWKIPVCDIYGNTLVRHIVAHCLYKATNGKSYLVSCFSMATINKTELKNNKNEKAINTLKEIKTKNAIMLLTNLIKSKLTKRCGLSYHRGYFKFQSVKIVNHVEIPKCQR